MGDQASTEEHVCQVCGAEHAEIKVARPNQELGYVCVSPECLMAAGMCPSCHVPLEVSRAENGEEYLSCPVCNQRG